MKRVLCIGDSLGLPRTEMAYENTWYSILTKRLPNFEYIPRFQRAMTTNFLVKDNSADYLENFKPNILIMQIGIVDCAPRYLPESSIVVKIINRLPVGLNNLFWKFWKKTKKRTPKYANVLPPNFRKNLFDFFTRCNKTGVEKVVVIKIAMPGTQMVNRNSEIINQVNHYNSIYHSLAEEFELITLIDPLASGKDDSFIEDGYHLSGRGAQLITRDLIQVLSI